jgi:hypothetical protein
MAGAGDTQATAVVVVGAMNPLIHHPAWYQFIGALSQAEADVALKNPQMICAQPVSQIPTGNLVLMCQLQRWAAQTSDPATEPRLVPIAQKVFGALEHTPVSAFGFSFNFVRTTKLASVDAFLGKLLGDVPLGLGVGTSGSFVWKSESNERQVMVNIASAKGKSDLLVVKSTFNYPIAPRDKIENFDLGELAARHFELDREEARTRLEAVLAHVP